MLDVRFDSGLVDAQQFGLREFALDGERDERLTVIGGQARIEAHVGVDGFGGSGEALRIRELLQCSHHVRQFGDVDFHSAFSALEMKSGVSCRKPPG